MSSPGGISPAIVAARVLDGISAEAQAVIDLMPNAVIQADQDRIVAIVDEAVDLGVWDTIDFFFCFAMDDPDNALTSWVGTKTATNVNAATHTALQGYIGNGTTQYLDTNIDITTDMTNFLQDDGQIEAYCYDNSDAGNAALFGLAEGGGQRTITFQVPAGEYISWGCNGPSVNHLLVPFLYQDNTRYGVRRTASDNQDFILQGVVEDNNTDASQALSNFLFAVLANGDSEDVVGFIMEGTCSYLLVGGGFNLTNLDTVLDTVETQFEL